MKASTNLRSEHRFDPREAREVPAEAVVNACALDDLVARRKAFKARNKAKAALHWYEERSRQEMRNMIHLVRKWAERKSANHRDIKPENILVAKAGLGSNS
jgi:serine/threonine protein kinase